MKTHTYLQFAVAAALGLALAACDRDATNSAERAGATVGRKIDSALDKTQQALADAGQKTEQHLEDAGKRISAATDRAVVGTQQAASDMKDATVATTNEVRTGDTGRAINDTAITASVKTDLLKDPDLSVLKIDVDTRDGVVTLNGLAGNEEARNRAEKMASSVKGVKEVRNFLTVKRA
jgi:hyperosmotically inducible periplasmic protein